MMVGEGSMKFESYIKSRQQFQFNTILREIKFIILNVASLMSRQTKKCSSMSILFYGEDNPQLILKVRTK